MTPRKQALLDAAIGVLGERGMRELTHRAVDAEAGVAAGSTANYFPTREALLEAIVERVSAMERDHFDDMALKVATSRAPTDAELRDLKFAFRVAKHVKSNTIVYAKDLATVGIGAGQMSRVDSARIAARKAQDAAAEQKLAEPLTKGSVVASDAYFPFADGMLACVEAGATAVIQPGGSMRDDEVVKAADEHGIAMVFTGVRHFRH